MRERAAGHIARTIYAATDGNYILSDRWRRALIGWDKSGDKSIWRRFFAV